MNAYADLTTLKSGAYLNITATTDDIYLRKLLEQASRDIDKACDRHFYVKTATRYFDGSASPMPIDDLLSTPTIKLDEDGDGTYESTLVAADYLLYPYNTYPKTKLLISNDSDYGGFAAGISKGVEIVGSWGFGDGERASPILDSGTTVASTDALDTTETGVDVTSVTPFSAGQTILIDSEQMYIQSIATSTLTVRRAMNGTTAATHAALTAIYIYEYPSPIVGATLITAMRAWKRKDSAYQDVVGSVETGMVVTSKGIDPDVMRTIKEYIRLRY